MDIVTTNNSTLIGNGYVCFKGDVIQIKRISGSQSQTLLTVYTTDKSFSSDYSLYQIPVVTHFGSSDLCNTTLDQILLYYNDYDTLEIEVIHNF